MNQCDLFAQGVSEPSQTSGKSVINSAPHDDTGSHWRIVINKAAWGRGIHPPEPNFRPETCHLIRPCALRSLSSCLTQRLRVTPTLRGVSTWYLGSFDVALIPSAISASHLRSRKKVKHDKCESARLWVCWNLSRSPEDAGGAGTVSKKIIKSAARHDLRASQAPQRCFILFCFFSSKSAFITVCTNGILSGIFPLIILSQCQMKLSSVPENNISLYKAVKLYSSPHSLAGCEPPIFTHRSICY